LNGKSAIFQISMTFHEIAMMSALY